MFAVLLNSNVRGIPQAAQMRVRLAKLASLASCQLKIICHCPSSLSSFCLLTMSPQVPSTDHSSLCGSQRPGIKHHFAAAHILVKSISRHFKYGMLKTYLLGKNTAWADASRYPICLVNRFPFTHLLCRVNEQDYQSLYTTRLHSSSLGYLSTMALMRPISSSTSFCLVLLHSNFFRS